MSAPEAERDAMSGHRKGSFGVRPGGRWVAYSSSNSSKDGDFPNMWCKQGDTVRLEFDAATHTL
eukprot:3306918-Prymnesium_polylepis.1